MSQPLRVGVVGMGVGRQHVATFKTLADQFQVRAVCDIDCAKAQAVASEQGVPRVAADLAEMCRMDDLDVIDLCTPSFLHYEQILQVLESGHHVICEKPVAGSLKQVDELIAAEAKSGKRMMPIFQYRFRNGIQQLKRLVDEGVTGRAYLTTVETAWRRRPEYYAVWHGRWDKELGGPIVTLAVHAHDILYSILGPAKSVFARAKTLVNPIETEDTVAASLEMADGSLATLAVTTGSAEQITRHRFCFSNLTAESNLQPYNNTSAPWKFTGDTPEIQQRIEDTLARFTPQPEGFLGQFQLFYQAIQTGAEFPVTLKEARASAELITAVYDSAQTGRAVSLPIGQDHPKYTGWRP
jgi:predicted dehydrogenase